MLLIRRLGDLTKPNIALAQDVQRAEEAMDKANDDYAQRYLAAELLFTDEARAKIA